MPRPLVVDDHILWCYSVARGSLYFTNCEVYLRYLRWSVAFFEWQHFFTWSCTVDDVQAFFLDVPGVQFGCRCDLWRIQTAAWTKAPLVVVWIRWLRPGSLLDSNPLPWKNTMLEHASAARTSKKQEYNIILDVYTRSIQETNRKMARSRI